MTPIILLKKFLGFFDRFIYLFGCFFSGCIITASDRCEDDTESCEQNDKFFHLYDSMCDVAGRKVSMSSRVNKSAGKMIQQALHFTVDGIEP